MAAKTQRKGRQNKSSSKLQFPDHVRGPGGSERDCCVPDILAKIQRPPKQHRQRPKANSRRRYRLETHHRHQKTKISGITPSKQIQEQSSFQLFSNLMPNANARPITGSIHPRSNPENAGLRAVSPDATPQTPFVGRVGERWHREHRGDNQRRLQRGAESPLIIECPSL